MDLMGVEEVAAYLGLSKQALNNRTHREAKFPVPVAILKMGRIWLSTDIAFYKNQRDLTPGAHNG